MNFVRLLSHIAFRLNEQARAVFVEILPNELAEQMQAPSGSEEHLEEWEQELLAAFDYSAAVQPENIEPEREAAAVDDEQEASAEAEPSSLAVPALLALLLATAPVAGRAGLLLFNIPLHIQGPVLHRLLTLSVLTCTRGLSDSECQFIEWLRRELDHSEHWGIEAAREILRGTGPPRLVRRLLLAVAEIDRESALLLQHYLYDFVDLIQLSDRDLQILLSNESNATLAQAFLDLPEREKKRFLRHVSARRRTAIAEERERYALVTPIEIEAAQRAVLATARFLYNTRRITTYFGSIEDVEREDELAVSDEEETKKSRNQDKKKIVKKEGISGVPLQKKIILGTGATVALILWYIFLFSGDSPEAVRSDRNEPIKRQVESGGSAAIVMRGGQREQVEQEYEKTDSISEVLYNGQRFETEAGVQAVVEIPGEAQLEVDELTHIEQVENNEGESGHVLALRVGHLRATVVDEKFELRTPVVRIGGPIGAKFATRVVLDATTTITVESRWVEVKSRVDPGAKWRLSQGEKGVFVSNGDGHMERKEE